MGAPVLLPPHTHVVVLGHVHCAGGGSGGGRSGSRGLGGGRGLRLLVVLLLLLLLGLLLLLLLLLRLPRLLLRHLSRSGSLLGSRGGCRLWRRLVWNGLGVSRLRQTAVGMWAAAVAAETAGAGEG